MTIEVGSHARHKCGGPLLYVFEIAFQGNVGVVYWDSVSGTFRTQFFPPDELEIMSSLSGWARDGWSVSQ